MVAQALGKRDIVDRLCDNLQLNIEHTKTTLNWKPIITFETGIKLCTLSQNDNE